MIAISSTINNVPKWVKEVQVIKTVDSKTAHILVILVTDMKDCKERIQLYNISLCIKVISPSLFYDLKI